MQRISIGVAKHQGNALAIPGLYVCNYVPICHLVGGYIYIWSRNKDFSQLVGSQEKAMWRCKATVGTQYTSL